MEATRAKLFSGYRLNPHCPRESNRAQGEREDLRHTIKENMRQLKINKSITAREGEALEKYLQEIGRENLITVEEEV